MVFPAVMAGWFLSFTLSIDDVIISFFNTGPTFEVLPLRIYSMVRLGLKPEVNALCAIMILITAVAVFASQRFLKEKS
jgi:spermidine/putrescine transport system permease protein